MTAAIAQHPKAKFPIDDVIYRRVFECDLLKVFTDHCNKTIHPYYLDRAERNRFAAAQLEGTPIKRVLNLGGGGKRHLKQSLSRKDIDVYEIDMQGDCDLTVNIDTLDSLPFKDNHFDAACAFDVLEHLENFHLLNEEMFRVSKDYMLISLPNSVTELFEGFLQNKPQQTPDPDRGTFSIFYGLPLRPPADRHRWWLYFEDIIRYYYYFALTHNATLEFWTPKLSMKKKLFKTIFGTRLCYTLFCPFVWIKVSKPGNASL
jgi:hypothetical protein